MIDHRNRKKKLIISYKNISDEVRELFKESYPNGYQDYLQKTVKPNGETIFVVPLETEDTSYMIKFDVKIDTGLVDEDLDKDLYGDDEREDSEFAPISEALEKEEGDNHRVGKLNHGAYEEIFEGLPEDKKEFEMANADIEEEFGDSLEDDTDDYLDDKDEDDDEDDDDMEPDDDDLLDIEALLNEADSGEGLLREENPPEDNKRGKKKESRSVKATKAVRSELMAAKKQTKEKKSAKEPKKSVKATKTTAKATKSAKVTVKKTTKTTKKSK